MVFSLSEQPLRESLLQTSPAYLVILLLFVQLTEQASLGTLLKQQPAGVAANAVGFPAVDALEASKPVDRFPKIVMLQVDF